MFGSRLYQLFKVVTKEGLSRPFGLPETALATVIALVVGYMIIGWFLKFVSTRSYRLFVWYRIFLGLALYLLLGSASSAPRTRLGMCKYWTPRPVPALPGNMPSIRLFDTAAGREVALEREARAVHVRLRHHSLRRNTHGTRGKLCGL